MATQVLSAEMTLVEHEQKSKLLIEQHQALLVKIETPEQFEMAVECVRGLKQLEKVIREDSDPDIQQAHTLHKSLITKRDKLIDPIVAFYKKLTGNATEFTREQERLRLAEEQRQREENQRIADEQARQQREKEQIDAAVTAETEGDTELAEQIIQAPQVVEAPYVAPPVVRSTVPSIKGVSKVRKNWKCRVLDESKVPREFLMVDQKKLDKYAEAMEAKGDVAGCEFYDAGNITIKL